MSSLDRFPRASATLAVREAFVEQEFHAGRDLQFRNSTAPSVTAAEVVDFWRQAGPSMWFAKDANFDRRFREGFLDAHEAAARGDLGRWMTTPEGALALLVLLDQFPRNAFRGTPRMYATDAAARRIAAAAIDAGHDAAMPPGLRTFFYLPFAHSEELADQERSVALCGPLGPPDSINSARHRDIVKRFGRFPHRNPILGRTMTADEQEFLDRGGYAG
ncbi:DUF924 family protein [Bradyrhizobium sp.]|uniref:DUF924 family protein n=1 Tax=Bradyrhizobium sp. TaxID=376 RepID=UPI002736B11C|nr:DUF924 family protein [Bradyrhizobium sp.]MDP3690236.1 DUF924 family protein [Bradyrhizobium sp.]